ncbi:MAG: GerW family sporulation protein [bacterium]|nr:GerW family sporulation protein [bacterium]
MSDHPIQGLMKTAMEAIKEMVDVNTIVGDAVETPDGNVIVPISRVSFGFAAGGTEYESDRNGKRQGQADTGGQATLPFGGGSGAGVSIQPIGFLVVGQGTVRLLPVDGRAIIDRLIDLAPQVLDQVAGLVRGDGQAYQAAVPAAPPRRTVGRRPTPTPGS